jgi:Right handed beta helix region
MWTRSTLCDLSVAALLSGFLLGGAGSTAPVARAATVATGRTCAEIQRAINALPRSGGEVRLRPTTYKCSASIVIDRDDVTLRGSGGATILRLADHANKPVLILGQTVAAPAVTRARIHVADLSIDGNRAQQDFECSGGPCSATDFLRNNGISLRRVEDVLIDHVTVRDARSGGLVTELGSRRVTVRDFTTFGNAFDGLAAYETEDSRFTGLYLHDNDGAGISLDIGFDDNIFDGGVLAGNKDVGIFMRDSVDNLFQGLQIRDSGSFGMFLAQVESDATKPAAGNTFVGLVISRSGRNESKGGAPIRVNDASCVDNLVAGAQFVANRDPGISQPFPGLVHEFGTIVR